MSNAFLKQKNERETITYSFGILRLIFVQLVLFFLEPFFLFFRLKSQNCTIKFSKWWTWVMGYVVLSTKQSRWQLLSLTVTLLASIISLWSAYRLGKEARDYYYPFGYHWLRHLLRPPQTVGIASKVIHLLNN